MNAIYLACLMMGLIGIVGALVGGDTGADGGDSGGGLPWRGLTTLATAFLGVGAGGCAATALGAGTIGAALSGAGSAIALVAVVQGLLLPYVLRQQSNSHIGRQDYIGLIGTVTLPIAPSSWGEVTFTDPDGTRVRGRAVSAEPVILPAGAVVYIGDVDDIYLHVISIPPADEADPSLHQQN